MTSLPGLTILPLTAEDAFKAISLMEEYDLDYEDSLHLATALRSGAKEMISDDQDFDGAPLRRAFP
jgi:predicted nucleic acid-binding protein